MKLLVIGSGGREHALVWKLSLSKKVDKIYCIPGNAGIEQIARCENIPVSDFEQLAKFVKNNKIDLTVVGPEDPLSKGIVNYFESRGLRIFGPDRNSAQFESSKIFAKEFMKKYGIPTAEFEVFDNPDSAFDYISKHSSRPLVVKADGLCAGKGVLVCDNAEEAKNAVQQIMVKKEFGSAGDKIIIEERLSGEEASLMAFCDGKTIVPMVASQDHKRVFDSDKGLNTGGMGAYAPASVVDEEIYKKAKEQVFDNFLKGLKQENIKFKGIIYAGIMISDSIPKVLEFNARFGDPETQVVLPLLKNDLVEVIDAVIDGKLDTVKINRDGGSCVCVVLASGGYPGSYEKGKEISGLESAGKLRDTIVFHAGTKTDGSKILTNGGRVLGVTALGKGLKEAIDNTYRAVKKIKFDKMHYRKDIGQKGLKK
ncbi:MAG: phosphoribosylamine--glycine ligase [Elusimicrobia bacterium CG1_02_37_114]|nr:MAG: phosphoribosylamine--glycine ligase [Elusimicrobia bacterium CG1_02_37_114]PIV52592.1 MAG: phosphoribosylamine--glycine ligase [Elusimicrobia bacterium CG02_land_8_20_14_3_00_37_13]PIZ13307.1 MAG: phosphoribosylamine--glycine ligase [Elusimicrobia bacterium CG_4_10_14_0_8_um_filter_37_32]